MIICLGSSRNQTQAKLNWDKMPGSGLQLLTVKFVGASELAVETQVQTCMKDSEVVKVNVTHVCFFT